jgi:hypothetical protein
MLKHVGKDANIFAKFNKENEKLFKKYQDYEKLQFLYREIYCTIHWVSHFMYSFFSFPFPRLYAQKGNADI